MTVMQTEVAVDPSAKLGEYMLKGWTMMGDICLECPQGIPLMRSKAQDQLICVACKKDYLKKLEPAIVEVPLSTNSASNCEIKTESPFFKYFSSLEVDEGITLKPFLKATIEKLNDPYLGDAQISKCLEHLEKLKCILL